MIQGLANPEACITIVISLSQAFWPMSVQFSNESCAAIGLNDLCQHCATLVKQTLG